ncbi:MAG: CHASE2 domain-containing protein, partial [Sulfurovaceae bacterium]|nr:CHASE2 domain-containing protein [Sulfurovaceae bacterium]
MVQIIDYLLYDFTVGKFYQEAKQDSYVVIVDIDEKSIESLGQWPWSRVIDAQLINKIELGSPSAIGINIIFPEIDKTSPIFIHKFYKTFFDVDINFDNLPKLLKDNDKLLIRAIDSSNVVVPIYLDKYPNRYKYCENISYQNNYLSQIYTPFKAPYILCNHQKLQEYIKNFGFINAESDSDGIFRRIPLFMSYRDKIFPSFALATLLSIDSNIKIVKKNQLELLERKIDMNSDTTVLINPNTPMPKVVSAIDVLMGNISTKIFIGKIVLLGSSVIGLNSKYILANKQKISSTQIHASIIENILSNSLITQPNFYKKVNIYISLILSLFIIIMLSKRWYISILILFIIIILLSLIYLFVGYKNHIYISIGYLLTPFLIYFFIMTTFFIVINSVQHKRFYKELIDSHVSTVESITFIVAIRDDETGEHLKRTKLYIKELAQYLYNQKQYPNILNKKYIENIYHASPLHDIGKLGIPDNILKKPGKFTPEEYEIMKQHPRLAKEAIEKAMRHYDKNDFLNIAYNIAYYHHERWDGKGYPVGLKGDDIPLEAQLMSIADVYDALVTKRC